MVEPDYLTAREFYKGIERLEARFDRWEARYDEKLAEHADRVTALEVRADSLPGADKKRAAGWASATAAFLLMVFEGIRALLPR